MKHRLFCALAVPLQVQNELANASESLRSSLSGGSISWTKPGNFHLTLYFLGDVDASLVDELALQLKGACQGTSPFAVECRGLGCFPSVSRPRVVWAGVNSAQSELALLQGKVATVCAPFVGQEHKNSFHGHITLGRIRHMTGPARAKMAETIEIEQGTSRGNWLVNEVDLVGSDLSQGSPRYTVLHRIALSG